MLRILPGPLCGLSPAFSASICFSLNSSVLYLLVSNSCDNGPWRVTIFLTRILQLLIAEADTILLARKMITERTALPWVVQK